MVVHIITANHSGLNCGQACISMPLFKRQPLRSVPPQSPQITGAPLSRNCAFGLGIQTPAESSRSTPVPACGFIRPPSLPMSTFLLSLARFGFASSLSMVFPFVVK